MKKRHRAALSVAGNVLFLVVVGGGLTFLAAGALLQGAWWMVLLIAGLIAWGIARPRHR